METFMNAILGGGIGAAIIGGVFAIVHIIFNKKVSTPADKLTKQRQELLDRNEILAAYKGSLSEAKNDIKGLQAAQEAQKKELGELHDEVEDLNKQALARDHYIYRCIGEIQRNSGTIPAPIPPGMDF